MGEIVQKTLIVLLCITTLIITFCGYKQEIEIIALEKENDRLNRLVQFQSSVIADLEENLRNK